MNNATKFIITVLVIALGIFVMKTYQSGGFENVKPVPATQEVDAEESH